VASAVKGFIHNMDKGHAGGMCQAYSTVVY
jgi:hypothetical protein